MPRCQACGKISENAAICTGCDGVFCEDCIDPKDHSCDSQSVEGSMGFEQDVAEVLLLPARRLEESMGFEQYEDSKDTNSSSGGRLIAGAILLATGALITITGFGAVIGIPLGLLGFAVMFPQLTTFIIILAILAFIVLAL